MLVVCDLQEGETPVARVRRDGRPCRGSCCRAHLEGCSFGHERQRKKVRTLLESIFGGRAKTGLPLAGVWKVYSDWLEGSERVLADITLRQRRCVCARFVDWAAKNYPAVKTADQVDRGCAAAYALFLKGASMSSKRRRNIIAGRVG